MPKSEPFHTQTCFRFIKIKLRTRKMSLNELAIWFFLGSSITFEIHSKPPRNSFPSAAESRNFMEKWSGGCSFTQIRHILLITRNLFPFLEYLSSLTLNNREVGLALDTYRLCHGSFGVERPCLSDGKKRLELKHSSCH